MDYLVVSGILQHLIVTIRHNIGTTSSTLDSLIFSATITKQVGSSQWKLYGLGNCMDDNNASMANFDRNAIREAFCRQTESKDKGAVAYDYQISCADW